MELNLINLAQNSKKILEICVLKLDLKLILEIFYRKGKYFGQKGRKKGSLEFISKNLQKRKFEGNFLF